MHSYKTNDPRGWCGDPARGAALGRPIITIPTGQPVPPLHLSKVRLSSDGYDSLGTYFGCPNDVYWVHSKDGQVDFCVRGATRYEAQQAALRVQSSATFIRPAVAPTVLDELAESAARAFFVTGYAYVMENYGDGLGGGDLYAQAPPTPQVVLQDYGYVFIDQICRRNGCTPEELWGAAQRGSHHRTPTVGDLGFSLAMEASGSGISWEDDHDPILIRGKPLEVGRCEDNPFYTHDIDRALPAKVRRAFRGGPKE
jgi:hypothetical protein